MQQDMDEKMQGFLINSLGMFFSPEMQACLAKVREIAGYDLSAEHKVPFLVFHKFITDPQPEPPRVSWRPVGLSQAATVVA